MIMSSQSLKSVVAEKFNNEHIRAVLEACSEPPCVLSLVQHENSTALIVLLSARSPPVAFWDLTLQTMLPINENFKCDDISSSPDGLIQFTVRSSNHRLQFKFQPSGDTSHFFSELYRLKEVSTGPGNFNWLQRYNNESPDSPDIAVVRHCITKGTEVMGDARESKVKSQMQMKEKEYTYRKPYRLFAGTWNVNGQPPPIQATALTAWLAVDQEPPDIYAIGFQELDLSKEAFLFNDTPREQEWSDAVKRNFHPGASYHVVEVVRLVGMMLIVAIKQSLIKDIKNVYINTVGTGIMGKMGNKGAVGLRMELHNTSICFVNCHLAAHVEEYERRNQDYRDICSRLRFNQGQMFIAQNNHVYFLGDMNYRITELEPAEVKEMLDKCNYDQLLKADQLRRQHSLEVVFAGYTEGRITFRPTYKYDPGTDEWDSSEKNRAPAWCDRILWKGDGISQLDYRSHPELKSSDHKPVSALFISEVMVTDDVKYRKVHEEVMKQFDKLENEFLPQATVDKTEIDFGELFYMDPHSEDLIIANTGQVNVKFEFIKKLDDSTFCKEWLHIEPYLGRIEPGQKCDVKLHVLVNKHSASRLNCGQDKLYDILVLHLEGGKDIFITVSGNYQRSCFGSSIEALVQVNVPVREIAPGSLMELESTEPTYPCYQIPKELWFLVDHLFKYGLKTPRLFLEQGLPNELVSIRIWLDNGSLSHLQGSVHSIAEALLHLLDSSSEPVIPFGMHSAAICCSQSYTDSRQLILQLPELRRNVFLYLCLFLQELLKYTADNGLDPKTLAALFGSIFLRDSPRSSTSGQPMVDRKKSSFVYHFLTNDQSDLINISP